MVGQSNRYRPLFASKSASQQVSTCGLRPPLVSISAYCRSIPLRIALEHDEQKGDDGRDGKAIISESAQTVPSKVVEQEPYCEVPYECRGNEACYEQQPFVRAHAGGDDLRKLQASCAGDDRNAHQEREPGRLLAPEPQKEAECDRGPRTRDAGHERGRLGEPDSDGPAKPKLGGLPAAAACGFGDEEQYANKNEVEDHHPWRADRVLQEILEQIPDQSRRYGRCDHEVSEPLVGVVDEVPVAERP